MAVIARPLLALLAAIVLLLVMWLTVPRPGPVAVRDTPLAPTGQIHKATDASAVSDEANRQLQQRLDEAAR